MMSALECFMNAARCEEKARASRDRVDRTALQETAQIWRKLGEESKTAEATVNRPSDSSH
jgi:hypothetical protein